MRRIFRTSLGLVLLASLCGAQTASAQYYDDGYDRPAPRRYYDERRPPRPDYRDDGYARPAPAVRLA